MFIAYFHCFLKKKKNYQGDYPKVKHCFDLELPLFSFPQFFVICHYNTPYITLLYEKWPGIKNSYSISACHGRSNYYLRKNLSTSKISIEVRHTILILRISILKNSTT